MRHVKLYKKRGIPGILRVEDHDNGKVTKLGKGEFDKMARLSALRKKLDAKRSKTAKQRVKIKK